MKPEQTFADFALRVQSELRRAYAGSMAAEAIPEAVGEALAYAWEHRRRLRRVANPVGYLYRVGHSRATPSKQGWDVWASDEAAPNVDPGLSRAMAALPKGQATAIWLVRACGWTNLQASEAFAINPSTVATHVSQAMERLSQELGVQDD